MKAFFHNLGAGIGVVLLLIGLPWLVLTNHLALFKVFAPREEQIRRETFEQSKAFVQGTVQELENMQVEYLKSDKAHRDALASIILHRAAGVDENLLPGDLRDFMVRFEVGGPSDAIFHGTADGPVHNHGFDAALGMRTGYQRRHSA